MPILNSLNMPLYGYGFGDSQKVTIVDNVISSPTNGTSLTVSSIPNRQVGDLIVVASFSDTLTASGWATTGTLAFSSMNPSPTLSTSSFVNDVGFGWAYYRLTNENINTNITGLLASSTGGHIAISLRNVSTTLSIFSSIRTASAGNPTIPQITISTTSKVLNGDTYTVSNLTPGSMVLNLAFVDDDIASEALFNNSTYRYQGLSASSFGITNSGGTILVAYRTIDHVFPGTVINSGTAPTYSNVSDAYSSVSMAIPFANL